MTTSGPVLQFDSTEARWRVLPTPFDPSGANPFTAGDVQAVAPDGDGGMWLVRGGGGRGPFFYRLTDRPRRPVFEDSPQPFEGRGIRHLASSADGTVWLAGDSGEFGRYDRMSGWSTFNIAGWDKDAEKSAVTAVAVAPDGTGVAVGERGQIASLGPDGARVERCACGSTPLRAVAVAPDGSAMAGGDSAEIVWKQAGGAFRPVRSPPDGARITGVALPEPGRAWVVTSGGDVFAGRLSGGDWSWDRDPPDDTSDTSEDANGQGEPTPPLRAIAMDADGHGYAVGDFGTVLERAGGAWRRVALGVSDDFTSVALPQGGGDGALIGGELGVVWTRVNGEFQLARPANPVDGYAGFGGNRVSGLALLPGAKPGEAEAWAALDAPDGASALLHYASDPDEPLTSPATRADPLPDAPAPRPGEISFVAFGKSDCANPSGTPCPGPSGTDSLSDVVARRVTEAVTSTDGADKPAFAVFTGDANDHGGNVSRAARPTMLNEWVDLVARPLDEAKVPVLGAIGVLDLSDAAQCLEGREVCVSSAQATQAGANVFWRQAMADRVGQGEEPKRFGGLSYRPVHDDVAPTTPDAKAANTTVPSGGARTHYAVDVVRDGQALVRLVFVDNALGSLRASDPLQQPPEPRGQLAWLDRILASRPAGARAVVVATSPSYAYRPESAAEAADDGTSFEDVVLKRRVSAVVSGRLGWNALYYALAPGLHCPGPGGAYPEHPPSGAKDCGRSSPLPADLPPGTAGRSAVPFVVSSSAGGKLAHESGEGYWHGYSKVRLDASGDPAKTIVEQRPILDWLVLTGASHRLRPGDRMTLRGVGREPAAADTPPRFHRLTGPAITHRYDLLVADPERPWLPYRDGDGRYVAMSERYPDCAVGCVDRQSGDVTAGEGNGEPVDAIGVVSVGDQAATYPLRFEPGAARKASAPGLGGTSPRAAALPTTPRSAPPSGSSSPPSAPAGPPASGSAAAADLPAFPAFPVSATAAEPNAPNAPTPGGPQPPPAPPPSPPAAGSPAAPPSTVPPRVSPVPPSAPQIKPAPKVKVRQDEAGEPHAALAGPEDDEPFDVAEEGVDPREHLLVDIAPAPSLPPGAATSRRERHRHDLPMTALESRDQPSAWLRDAGYGGGLVLAALALTSGWVAIRSRRRDSAAPALAARRRRGG